MRRVAIPPPSILPVQVPTGVSTLPGFQDGTDGFRENFTLPGPSDSERTVRMWLPPSYFSQPHKRYPLLVMQDGQNLFEDKTSFYGVSWRLGATAFAGMTDGRLGEFIIAGVDHAYARRVHEYSPWPDPEIGEGGGAGAYIAWVERTLLPELEGRYRIEPGSRSRIIGGSSLGALVSLMAVVEKPRLFGGAILMSGTWNWGGVSLGEWVADNWRPGKRPRLWLDMGDQEGLLTEAYKMREALVGTDNCPEDERKMRDPVPGLGYREGDAFGFLIAEGASHNEASWRARVHEPLEFFFPAGGAP